MTERVDPMDLQASALLVVDMQNDFLAAEGYYARRECLDLRMSQGAITTATRNRLLREPSSAPSGGCSYRDASLARTIDNVCTTIRQARTKERPIAFLKAIYSRHFELQPAFLLREPDRNHYPCKPHSWGAEFIEPIDELIGLARKASAERVIEKHTFDGFFQTGLLSFLRQHKVQTAVIVGVETHVCVLTTAQSAAVNQFKTVILEDCVWTANAELGEKALEIFRDASGDTALLGDWYRPID